MLCLTSQALHGAEGNDGEKIEVKDIPAMESLSYTWQGSNSLINRTLVMMEHELELVKINAKDKEYRLLGYNGPGVPDSMKTWEMIVTLPDKR